MFGFKLKNVLSASSTANGDDVLGMKQALNHLGEYDPPPAYGMTPYPDTPMFDGMKAFQKKNGLTVDGFARPGGPTETTLNSHLANSLNDSSMKRVADFVSDPKKSSRPMNWFQPAYIPGTGKEVTRPTVHFFKKAIQKADGVEPALRLGRAVGLGQVNRPQDVIGLKNALAWVGHYPVDKAHQQDATPDEDLHWALMGFQRDYGLKTDGFSRPGGETESRINELISPLIKRASTTTAQTRSAAPSLDEPQTQIAKVEPSQTSHPMQLAQAQGSPSGNTGAVNHGNTMQGTGVNQRQSPSASSSYSSLFQQYRGNLGPREGGIANRPKTADPGGLTNKGMSQKELDRLRQIPRWSNLPARSAQLTDTQIDAIFHEEYFKRPQIEKLANVPGLSAAAPKLAEQVFDAGVQHGILDAGRWLQESIDEVTGTDLRVTDKKGNKLYDGIVGSGTRRALETAVANGKAKEINNRIVQKRVPYMKSRPEFGSNPGWILRAKSFEMP